MQFQKDTLPTPEIRTVEDIRPVLADPTCRVEGPLYFMYRDLSLTPEDRAWLHQNDLRYDITIISRCDLCGEYAKTMGHYHPATASGTGYPEIYEVLEGSAHYLLQRKDLSDVVLVYAVRGDLVLVPPGYGHVTINPGTSELVMANMVSRAFKSEYHEYERRKGGAYYELAGGRMVRNPEYPDAPPLRSLAASQLRPLLPFPPTGLYGMVGTSHLTFLNFPEQFPDLFRVYQGG